VVQSLLSRVPALKLLVTSRQLLGLSAEHEFVLSPLAIPGGGETPEQLSLYESVQLFIDRAQQVMPHFQVSNANAAAVAALVAGLEGIPLAIELAAARVQVLSPAQMLSQLSHRFDFLASRKRDSSERHRTLRAAVEWSYRLLSPELQRFFARLSVFHGGWSVEAAEAVCEEPLALDYLEQLRECSLVLAEGADGTASGTIRFRMLETLREFAAQQLIGRGEEGGVRQRHLEFFLSLAEEAAPEMTGPEQAHWLDVLEAEHDNLRQGLTWCLEQAQEQTGKEEAVAAAESCEKGLRLGAALHLFWVRRGHLSEGRERLSSLLRLPLAQERTQARALALHGAGSLAQLQGDNTVARLLLEEGLALSKELGHKSGIARCLCSLGQFARSPRDYVAARSLYEESLTLYRELGDKPGIALCLKSLGIIVQHAATFGEPFREPPTLLEESLALYREMGDKAGIASCAVDLAYTLKRQGDYVTASSLYEESLALATELQNKVHIDLCLNHMGLMAYDQGDYSAARSLLEQSLAMGRELGRKNMMASSLSLLAIVAHEQGDSTTACSLQEESLALCRDLGDNYQIAVALSNLSEFTQYSSDWSAARSLYEESLALFREIGDQWWVGVIINALGLITAKQGDCVKARSLLEQSLAIGEEVGNQWGIADCLLNFGCLHDIENRPSRPCPCGSSGRGCGMRAALH
jgi:predicted ATPase